MILQKEYRIFHFRGNFILLAGWRWDNVRKMRIYNVKKIEKTILLRLGTVF